MWLKRAMFLCLLYGIFAVVWIALRTVGAIPESLLRLPTGTFCVSSTCAIAFYVGSYSILHGYADG